MSINTKNSLSKRQFLKYTGLGAFGLMLASITNVFSGNSLVSYLSDNKNKKTAQANTKGGYGVGGYGV